MPSGTNGGSFGNRKKGPSIGAADLMTEPMEQVQYDKEKAPGSDAWAEVLVGPLSVSGPVVHNDHAYQLFIQEREFGQAEAFALRPSAEPPRG